MTDFIFGGSKITAYVGCSHKIKRCLFLGRKAMANQDSILKSRDITSPTKVHLVKVMVFPVVMYGLECWSIKKAECWRIDAFEPWCWRRLLRAPWAARRSNQSVVKEISPEYSLDAEAETPTLWQLDGKNWLIGKYPDDGKGWGRRKMAWHRMRRLHGISDPMDMSLSKLWELVVDRESWCAALHWIAKSWIWLSNWTELTDEWFLKEIKNLNIYQKNHVCRSEDLIFKVAVLCKLVYRFNAESIEIPDFSFIETDKMILKLLLESKEPRKQKFWTSIQLEDSHFPIKIWQ